MSYEKTIHLLLSNTQTRVFERILAEQRRARERGILENRK